jgi:hypothetical protein
MGNFEAKSHVYSPAQKLYRCLSSWHTAQRYGVLVRTTSDASSGDRNRTQIYADYLRISAFTAYPIFFGTSRPSKIFIEYYVRIILHATRWVHGICKSGSTGAILSLDCLNSGVL